MQKCERASTLPPLIASSPAVGCSRDVVSGTVLHMKLQVHVLGLSLLFCFVFMGLDGLAVILDFTAFMGNSDLLKLRSHLLRFSPQQLTVMIQY